MVDGLNMIDAPCADCVLKPARAYDMSSGVLPCTEGQCDVSNLMMLTALVLA